jgi:glycosyltransferase involved in cell wall biosynthesis
MPDFSVIVPTYDRPIQLFDCLESLYQMEYDGDFEVVVVNDGSSVSYEEVETSFPQVRWVHQKNSGPGTARNSGASHSEGKFLAFLDDDCRADRAWLTRLAEGFQEFPESVLGGTTVALDQGNLYDVTAQLVQHLAYNHFNRDSKSAAFFASNNLAVSRDLFLKSGGFCPLFDRTASEDREWCNRALSEGWQLVWRKDAVIFHYPNLCLRRYSQMFFRYGRGAALFHSHRREGSLISDSNFYAHLPTLLRSELQRRPELPRLRTLLLLCLWQVSNIAGFLFQRTGAGSILSPREL